MKHLLFMLTLLFAIGSNAQTEPSGKKSKPSVEKKSTQGKHHQKKSKTPKTGKSDPTEKGSGMTVPDQDKPKLDARPNPAATVPSTEIQVDGNPKR